jgi:kynurenine formamidase
MRLFLDSTQFIDTDKPLNLSMGLTASSKNVRAWYVDQPRFVPVRENGFLGSVAEGGNVNFRDVFFNPHGHGTHTECCGHITEEVFSVNQTLKKYFFKATLITITPKKLANGDSIITSEQFNKDIDKEFSEALLIRTLPNEKDKCEKNYSSTNPPYLDISIIELLQELEVKHLLVDLPSVDREEDKGELAFHHAFWNVPNKPNLERTITELIFVENKIPDGKYLLEIQMAPFENDASPSRPVLYKIDFLEV